MSASLAPLPPLPGPCHRPGVTCQVRTGLCMARSLLARTPSRPSPLPFTPVALHDPCPTVHGTATVPNPRVPFTGPSGLYLCRKRGHSLFGPQPPSKRLTCMGCSHPAHSSVALHGCHGPKVWGPRQGLEAPRPGQPGSRGHSPPCCSGASCGLGPKGSSCIFSWVHRLARPGSVARGSF